MGYYAKSGSSMSISTDVGGVPKMGVLGTTSSGWVQGHANLGVTILALFTSY